MTQQAVAFGVFSAKIFGLGLTCYNTHLNNPFTYWDKDGQRVKKLAETTKILSDRQAQLCCMFSEIIDQEQLMSSVKISPDKKTGMPPATPKPVPKSVPQDQPETKTVPKVYQKKESSLKTDVKISTESTETKPDHLPAKLVTFKLTQQDRQIKIRPPSVSQNAGLGCYGNLKSKLNSLVECNYCSDVCYPVPGLPIRIQPYQVQVSDKQMRNMVAVRNAPTSKI